MANNNNGGNMRPRTATQNATDKPAPAPAPTPTPPPADEPTTTPGPIGGATPGDDSVVVETPTPTPETPKPEEPTVEDNPEVILDEENKGLVGKLDEMLDSYKEAISKPGRDPEEFADSAGIVRQITRFIVKTPRLPVLDRFLKFFEDNKDELAAERVYLKGVSTLSSTDQQQITYLHTLFTDLVSRRPTKINNSTVLQVLKKPEIVNYYNRRISAMQRTA